MNWQLYDHVEPNNSEDEKPQTIKFSTKGFGDSENIKHKKAFTDFTDSDFISDDEYNDHTTLTLQHSEKTHQVLRVSQITPDILKNIAHSMSDKIFDSVNGTTCHQCRQKTLDQKSICRYKNCGSGRGMFCGYCLENHYGKSVAEVLMNKKWVCPVCRGSCNCSICNPRKD